MTIFQHTTLFLGALLAGTAASAQPRATPPLLQEFSRQRIQHQRTLGITLGSYALANIAVGALAAGKEPTESHYFHRMNLYWNAVNLGIAGLGLLGSRPGKENDETLSEAVKNHQRIKQTLLFNTGLDLAYLAGGAYLIERGRNQPDDRARLTGFGKSIMVQGGFLFVFDLVNYALFKRRGDKQQQILLGRTTEGIGLAVSID